MVVWQVGLGVLVSSSPPPKTRGNNSPQVITPPWGEGICDT